MAPREIGHYLHSPALSLSHQAGYTVATIGGDLDIAGVPGRTRGVPALREQLLGVLGPHANRMIIDLSGVTFCDASGLAVLVGVGPDRRLTSSLGVLARAQAGADRTALIDAARSLLAGLLRHPLTHFPSVAAAAAELRRVLPFGMEAIS